MKYGEISFGQVEALINKLGGLEVAQRILKGPDLKRPIRELLRNNEAGVEVYTLDSGVEMRLFHFGRKLYGQQVIEHLRVSGFRGMTSSEVKDLGNHAQTKHLTSLYSIAAVGSSTAAQRIAGQGGYPGYRTIPYTAIECFPQGSAFKRVQLLDIHERIGSEVRFAAVASQVTDELCEQM